MAPERNGREWRVDFWIPEKLVAKKDRIGDNIVTSGGFVYRRLKYTRRTPNAVKQQQQTEL